MQAIGPDPVLLRRRSTHLPQRWNSGAFRFRPGLRLYCITQTGPQSSQWSRISALSLFTIFEAAFFFPTDFASGRKTANSNTSYGIATSRSKFNANSWTRPAMSPPLLNCGKPSTSPARPSHPAQASPATIQPSSIPPWCFCASTCSTSTRHPGRFDFSRRPLGVETTSRHSPMPRRGFSSLQNLQKWATFH